MQTAAKRSLFVLSVSQDMNSAGIRECPSSRLPTWSAGDGKPCKEAGKNPSAAAEFLVSALGRDHAGTLMFAAEEFSKYCGMIFGKEFKISEATEESPACSAAVVGDEISRDDVARAGDGYKEDEYEIAGGGGKLILCGGTPRAVLFAVYDFLETNLGCRWYYPDPENQIVPRHDIGKLSGIMGREFRHRKRPEFQFREREYQGDCVRIKNVMNEVDWWAKLRMNVFLFNWAVVSNDESWKFLKEKIFPEIRKRGLETGLAEHGAYALFLNHEKYFKKHPDWFCFQGGKRIFALNNGRPTQICTKNPQGLKEFLNNFRIFAGNNPELTIYSPSPNDGGGWCKCALCKPHPVADRYMELDNKIASVLAEVNRKTEVLHLIYGSHKEIPQKIIPEPNIILDVALWGRDYAYDIKHRKADGYHKLLIKLVDYSRQVSRKLIHHCKFMRQTWLGMRLLPLRVINKDMKYFHELGLYGFDFPLASIGMWTKSLPVYIVAKKCWDPGADISKIVPEFFGLYYGKEHLFAEKAYRQQMEAFPNNIYGGCYGSKGNFSITWHPPYYMPGKLLKSKKTYIKLMRKSTATSRELLQAALNEAEIGGNRSEGEIYKKRFEKLCTAIKEVVIEQEFLNLSAVLTEAVTAFRRAGAKSKQKQITELYSSLKQTFLKIEINNSLENDAQGLLWSGRMCNRFKKSFGEWDTIINAIMRK